MKRKPIAAVEFLPRRFYFVTLRTTPRLSLRANRTTEQQQVASTANACLPTTPGIQYIALDEHLALAPSLRSTGICSTVQFHAFLARFLDGSSRIPSDASDSNSSANSRRASVYYFYVQHTSADIDAHVIHLVCQWRLVHLQLSVQDAVAPFEHMSSLFPTMQLTSQHCDDSSPLPSLRVSLAGIAKGLTLELLGAGLSTTVLQQIAEQQQLRYLDSSERDAIVWITKRLLVLSDSEDSDPTRTTATAARSAPQLKQQHVTLVIRLESLQDSNANDTSHWTALGIEVADLTATAVAATDGGGDRDRALDTLHGSSAALARFLDVCESATGVTAVHASRGSGRAATLLGCYLMKHLQFTSREAFGWLHWCGLTHMTLHHQLFLDRMQLRMWRDGDAFRRTQHQCALASVTTDAYADATDALQISIGNMNFTRHSLFGTKGDKQQQLSSRNVNGTAGSISHANSSREPHAPVSSSSSPTQQQPLKRRPLTQGSTVRRPRIQSAYRNGESGGSGLLLRADFAQMHKFLHQTGSTTTTAPATPRGSSASESVRTAAAATALPSVHTS